MNDDSQHWLTVVPAMPGEQARLAFKKWLESVRGTPEEPDPNDIQILFCCMADKKSAVVYQVWRGPARTSFHSDGRREETVVVVPPMKAADAREAYNAWFGTVKGTASEPQPQDVQIKFHDAPKGRLASYVVRASVLRKLP
ncbi:MAG: hypothetical protein K8T20_15690 [Planctomycetes bacterium]|nr:hypothetical protein [Planctomycetota bacterium]